MILRLIHKIQLKLAIRKANKLHKLTHYKYLVINWKGKPIVIAKRQIKTLIGSGYFVKGTTVQTFERAALYIT